MKMSSHAQNQIHYNNITLELVLYESAHISSNTNLMIYIFTQKEEKEV
jgi:hypothetical protein